MYLGYAPYRTGGRLAASGRLKNVRVGQADAGQGEFVGRMMAALPFAVVMFAASVGSSLVVHWITSRRGR